MSARDHVIKKTSKISRFECHRGVRRRQHSCEANAVKSELQDVIEHGSQLSRFWRNRHAGRQMIRSSIAIENPQAGNNAVVRSFPIVHPPLAVGDVARTTDAYCVVEAVSG